MSSNGGNSKSHSKWINVSVGILGHVDSGKTTLARALSTVASTAAFDKHPDLGFSAFYLEPKQEWKDVGIEQIQVTLVDCPGHASLVKTIIGGAQIIDLMLLVVDATKGIQTQTAECIVIGDVVAKDMIVVLNKIDLFPPQERAKMIEKVTAKLRKALQVTRFANVPMIPVSASTESSDASENSNTHVKELLNAIRSELRIPQRSNAPPFLFAVDHCFPIKGQGTVMTGTVLHGCISVGDMVDIAGLGASKKIKSIQMFKKPVNTLIQGDRAGICVTQFDSELLERGLISTPGTLKLAFAAIVSCKKIRYYKSTVESKAKFHCSVGHETVMAQVTFFGSGQDVFEFEKEYETSHALKDGEPSLALLEFEKPILLPPSALYIASKLDMDINLNTCRLAFSGTILHAFPTKDFKSLVGQSLKVFKWKERKGSVDRIVDERTLIGKGLFEKDQSIDPFTNMSVTVGEDTVGKIESGFGQSGKYKVYCKNGIPTSISENVRRQEIPITLRFKKYLGTNSKLKQ